MAEYIKRKLRAENVHSTEWERPRVSLMDYEIKRVKSQVKLWDKIWMPTGNIIEQRHQKYGYVVAMHKDFFVLQMNNYKEAFQWVDLVWNWKNQKRKEAINENKQRKG